MVSTNLKKNVGIALTGDKYDHGHGHTHYITVGGPKDAVTVIYDDEGVIHNKDEYSMVFDAYNGYLSFYRNDNGPVKNAQNMFLINADKTISVQGFEKYVIGLTKEQKLAFVPYNSADKLVFDIKDWNTKAQLNTLKTYPDT